MKSHQSPRTLLLGFFALVLVCVHLSDGSSISSREIKSESSSNDIKPQKKTQFHKKYQKQSPIIEKKSPKNKLKISDLRPCISKAFCEVNSITEEPTYETSREFYMILNRLKKFIDDGGEKADLGSGSAEDDYSGSSEESYERYMNNNNGPHRSGSPPYYRRGKSLAEVEAKLKKKKNKKLAKTDKSKASPGDVVAGNATLPEKVYSPAQIEQRAFVDRKTQELNVVDDLAALIKISAEIGQALRSPRRCRSLFKKCRMTYEQIIRIFNRTQSVETSDQDLTATTPEPFLVVETLPVAESPSPTDEANAKPTTDQEESGNETDQDGNRNKKSRTDFSDDEDPEYITDPEAESHPMKTYSLFSTSQSDSSPVGGSKRQETIVDEAFHKFEKVFPSSDAPDKTQKLYQNQKGSISSKLRPVVAASSSEEEEESDESLSSSGEVRRPIKSDYSHRSSAEDNHNNKDSEEVEMEVPDKKIKTKHNTRPVKENPDLAGDVDEAEDDSDAEIASSEIGKKPEEDGTPPKKSSGTDSSEEDVSGEGPANQNKEQEQGDLVFTRDDDKSGGFNTYGFYPQVRPSFSKHPTKSVKSKGRKKKGNKKGQKEEKPQEDQNSSEEDLRDPERDMPPPESDFYQVLKQVDDGKGADVIPGKGPKGKKSKSKRKYQQREPEYSDYQDYPSGNRRPGKQSGGGGGYGGGYSSMEGPGPGYGSGEGPQDDQQGPQQSGGGGAGGFFQSIMGWFSRGKSSQTNTEPQQGQYSGGGGYYGNDGGGNKRPYEEEPSYNRPQKYSSDQYDSYNGPSSGGRRKPYGGDRDRDEEEEYPTQGKPPRNSRHPQGRGGDSSEEEEEEDEEVQPRPVKRQIQKRRPTESSSDQQAQYLSSSGLSASGPPPPLVIDPAGDQVQYPNQNQQSPNNRKPKNPTKQAPPPPENSEESKEDNSSEEKATQKSSSTKQATKKKTSNKAENDKVFSGMFASAAEIDKQIVRDKDDYDRDDPSLLLSTFDSVANTFSTSADKIRDWSEEDNSRKKINVGLFATNTRGKYTVKRNRNRDKNNNAAQQGSFEVEDKNEKGSSEEEGDKK